MNTTILSGTTANFLQLISLADEAFKQAPNRLTDAAERAIIVCQSIYTTLTSERSIRRYRAAWWFVKSIAVICWLICVASVVTVRDWCNAEVERHLMPEAVEEVQNASDAPGAVLMDRVQKFPVFQQIGSLHNFEKTPIGLLPASAVVGAPGGVRSKSVVKPSKSKRKSRRGVAVVR